MTSAEGIDVSHFQVDLAVHDLSGLQFAFSKATDGTGITDPNFAANWATIKAAGLHRGAYHELQSGLPASQAAHFLATVQGQGLAAGDMLAVVASDYPGVTDEDVWVFCEAVRQATHGHNPVLAYTDLSVGASLGRTSGAGYPLWVAWPSPVAPHMPLANWRGWTCWQWGTRFVPGLGNVDANAYNGTPAEMGAWIASYKPSPPHAHQEDAVGMLTAGPKAETVIAFTAPGAQKGIRFANDCTLAGLPAPVLRVAAHSATGHWRVDTLALAASGADLVGFADPDVDFVSVTRWGGDAGDSVAVGWALA